MISEKQKKMDKFLKKDREGEPFLDWVMSDFSPDPTYEFIIHSANMPDLSIDVQASETYPGTWVGLVYIDSDSEDFDGPEFCGAGDTAEECMEECEDWYKNRKLKEIEEMED